MQDCRLIIEDSEFRRRGAMNMAIDETLLQMASENGVTILRFYGWHPATLSLGYFQKATDRESHQPSLGCDLVRRASGGGAIMHDQELTYAFATPTNARWSDTEQTYLAFHETLVDVLAEYAVKAKLHDESEGLRSQAFLCFQRRAVGDVTLEGQKIMGSAQRRAKNALLQHGSLLLAKSPHAPELDGIQEIAGKVIEVRELTTKWLQRLSARLKISFFPEGLSDNELEVARELCDQKFDRDTWICRR